MGMTSRRIRAAMRDGGAVFYVTPQEDAFGERVIYSGDVRSIEKILLKSDCQVTRGRGGEPQLHAGGTYEIQAYSEDQVESVRKALYVYGWRVAAMASWPEYDRGGEYPLRHAKAPEVRGLRRILAAIGFEASRPAAIEGVRLR